MSIEGCKSIKVMMPSFTDGTGVKTRTNFDPVTLALSWSSTDTIGIFPEKGDQVNFAMSGGSGNVATFTGGGWALKNNSTYYAYYPFSRACYAGADMKEHIPVSMLGQTQTGDNSTAHLGKYAYMYSDGTVAGDGKVDLQLHHATTILKLVLTLPVDGTVASVALETVDNSAPFYTKSYMNIAPHSSSIIWGIERSENVSLHCKNLSVKANAPFTAYIALFPVDLTGKYMRLSLVTNDGEEYFVVFQPSKQWEAGKYYTLDKTLNKADVQVLLNPTAQSIIKSTNANLKIVGTIDDGFWGVLATAVQSGNVTSLDLGESVVKDNMITTQLQQCSKLSKLILPNSVEHVALSKLPSLDYLRIGDKTRYIEELTGTRLDENYCSPKQEGHAYKTPAFYQQFRELLLKFKRLEVSKANMAYAFDDMFFSICKPYISPLWGYKYWNLWTAIACVADKSVTSIRMKHRYGGLEGTFCGFDNLERVEMVEDYDNLCYSWNLHFIGSYTFYNCSHLKSINSYESCINLCDMTGIRFIEPFAFENCTNIVSVRLPEMDSESDRSFLEYLDGFSGCTNLESVSNGSSSMFVQMGSSAFSDCIKLVNAPTPHGGNSKIGGDDESFAVLDRERKGAFNGCSSLKSVNIGAEFVADGSFLNCNALQDIYVSQTTPPTIGRNVFSVEYPYCTLHVPAGSELAYRNSTYWSRFFQ